MAISFSQVRASLWAGRWTFLWAGDRRLHPSAPVPAEAEAGAAHDPRKNLVRPRVAVGPAIPDNDGLGGRSACGGINVEGSSAEVTTMLRALSDGDQSVLPRLLPLVYEELREAASRAMRRERPDHTLQVTALVHEAYLRLVDQRDAKWEHRSQFLAVAAQMMRRVLVDHARARRSQKRGGDADGRMRVVRAGEDVLERAAVVEQGEEVDLEALDAALTRLGMMDARQAQVVELRYFAGLSLEQTAEVTGLSLATVKREWNVAKAWLRRELTRGAEGGGAEG
jgi:RNA polymerase sigma-70 factor (ECF subfamily)